MGSERVVQLLNIFHAGTSKKRLFLTAWRSAGLGNISAIYIYILLNLGFDSICSQNTDWWGYTSDLAHWVIPSSLYTGQAL